jgi:serine/threonine protein kinase
LVNLTCGRNPWKRASTSDSTFKTYLKDSKFLRSILPLSSELDSILRRIFECDPQKRVTIPELRGLILRCQKFTTHPNGLPTPDHSPIPSVDNNNNNNNNLYAIPHPTPNVAIAPPPPSTLFTPPSPPPEGYDVPYPQYTTSSGSSDSDGGSVFSDASTGSSSSSCSEYHYVKAPPVSYHKYVPPILDYSNIFTIALDLVEKPLVPQAFARCVRVY